MRGRLSHATALDVSLESAPLARPVYHYRTRPGWRVAGSSNSGPEAHDATTRLTAAEMVWAGSADRPQDEAAVAVAVDDVSLALELGTLVHQQSGTG